jgi:predicted extracellular nuclease
MKTVIASLAALAALASSASATIRITEWMYNGSEFVEITNVGGSSVDMTGWSYDDNSRLAGTISLSGLGTLAAGQSGILAEESDVDFRTLWNLSASVPVVGGNTANLGRNDEINIYDASNVLVDRLTYNDQVIGGPRTQDISGNIMPANLGSNLANLAVASLPGDAFASYAVVNSSAVTLVANPGSYVIPEPATLGLLAAGAVLAMRRR